MDANSLFDIGIQIGASGQIPFLNIIYNDTSYNVLSFLENNAIYSMIIWIRDIIGAYYLINVVADVIIGIPHIIRGKWSIGHRDMDAFNANVEGYRWDV